jgi:putative phosphoribosyl transferase
MNEGASSVAMGRSAAVFADRADAGNRLAHRLQQVGGDVVVLGLARGGVAVAAAVAKAWRAPLDIVVVRKIGVPWQPELAMGAVAEGGIRIVDHTMVAAVGVSAVQCAAAEAAAVLECERLAAVLRSGRDPIPLRERVAVLVDDGLATGNTALAAIAAVRARGARRVVLAVPVAAQAALARLHPDDGDGEHPDDGDGAVAGRAGGADEVVAVRAPTMLRSVGQWYADFRPVTDAEVIDLLASTRTGDVDRE